jgi:Putative transposase
LLFDGVYTRASPTARPRFHRLPPPTDADIGMLLTRLHRRVRRLLLRRGRWPDEDARGDPFAAQEPLFASAVAASLQGRVALGPRAGARVRRLGDEPDLGHVPSRGPRQAQLEGFDLHANVWVPPNDRARLEQLCRYLLRPPLAQDRVRLRADGRILVDLKTVWRDGTAQLLFEPIEFMEKLAAIIPRPAVNLLIYHGVLAPHARTRSQVVRYGRPAADPTAPEVDASPRPRTPGAGTWPALMRRVFDLDVLACPRCGGRLRVIAIVQDPAVVRTILTHVGRALSTEAPGPAPPAPAAIG